MSKYVQSVYNAFSNSTSGRSTSLTSFVNGNDSVVFVATDEGAGTATVTVVDDHGSTYSRVGEYTRSGTISLSMWRGTPTSGGTVQVTVTPNVSAKVSITQMEYLSLGVVNGSNQSSGSSSTASTGNIITGGNDTVIVGVSNAGGGGTAGTGFTLHTNNNGSGVAPGQATEDQDSVASNPINPTFNNSFSTTWLAVGGSFGTAPAHDTPIPRQNTQQYTPPPDHSFQWWQQPFQRIPIPPVHDNPLPHQAIQYYSRTEQSLSYLEQLRYNTKLPGPALTQAQAPPLRRAESTFHPSPVIEFRWWMEQRRWPVPVEFIPVRDNPPLRQNPQRFFERPIHEIWWWQRPTKFPIFPTIIAGRRGYSGVYGIVQTGCSGIYRVKNDIAGYVVWVGDGVRPNLDGPATTFSFALPVNIPVAPAVVGTRTYYVVVRLRDHYGLLSQNQYPYSITVDTFGNRVLPALHAPVIITAKALPEDEVGLLLSYPYNETDEFPADKWRIWIGASPPVITNPPTVELDVDGRTKSYASATLTPGTYYIAVVLYRSADAAVSPAVNATVAIPDRPVKPVPVRGGFEL